MIFKTYFIRYLTTDFLYLGAVFYQTEQRTK